jgi:hypothetical protein
MVEPVSLKDLGVQKNITHTFNRADHIPPDGGQYFMVLLKDLLLGRKKVSFSQNRSDEVLSLGDMS